MFNYASGARYEGEWKDNAKHGYGKFFFKDGTVFAGINPKIRFLLDFYSIFNLVNDSGVTPRKMTNFKIHNKIIITYYTVI